MSSKANLAKVVPLPSRSQRSKLRNSCLDLISQAQQADGSFFSFSSPQLSPFKAHKRYKTTFFTSLILQLIKDSGNKEVVDQAVKFLTSQKSKDWTYNYWARDSKEIDRLPYPDDLDDSSCAWVGISLSRPELLLPGDLAKITKVLSVLEVKPGGPYRSWLVQSGAKKIWRDVDLAVNANVAYFLACLGVEVPGLNSFLNDSLLKHNFYSPYYASEFPVIFFLSRLKLENVELLATYLGGKITGNGLIEDSILKTALVALSFRNIDCYSQSYHQLLTVLENLDFRLIEAESFCLDPSIGGIKHFAGSRALTASFVYSALLEEETSHQVTHLSPYEHIHRQVLLRAKKRVQSKTLLGEQLAKFISIQGEKDPHREITTFPYWFASNLKAGFEFSGPDLIGLCEASFWGWVAYTVFDNFLDNEGVSANLPLACFSKRQLSLLYSSYGRPINKLFVRLMDEVDEANVNEILNLRRDRFDRLNFEDISLSSIASKSVGHILGPLSVVMLAGYSKLHIYETESMLRSYLVLKQLNDDLHDWQDDLKNGHINPVNAKVLMYSKGFDLNDWHQLRLVFWKKAVDAIANDARPLITKADKSISQSIFKEQFLYDLFGRYKKALKKTVTDKDHSLDFISNFTK